MQNRRFLDLITEIKSQKASELLPEIPCNLKRSCEKCRGRGFEFVASGPYAKAKVCCCIIKCTSCLGTAQRIIAGKATLCHKPSPRRIVNLLNQAHIPSRYVDSHLGMFKNMTGNCLKAVQKMRHWVHQYTQKKVSKGLVISGPVGVGKTYMITSLAKSLAMHGVSVRFVDFFQLLTQIRATYTENRSEKAIFGPLINVDVLFIDELGKGRNTDFEAAVLDQLIMNRYNENKIIVASTNHSLDAESLDEENYDSPNFHQTGSLEKRVGKRIYSRLLETTDFVEMRGEDFRRQIK